MPVSTGLFGAEAEHTRTNDNTSIHVFAPIIYLYRKVTEHQKEDNCESKYFVLCT